MHLKLMNRDDDGYRIIMNVEHVAFTRDEKGDAAQAEVTRGEAITRYALTGNAYLVNDDGRTIDSFWLNERPARSRR